MTGYEYFEQVLKSKGLKPYDVSKGTGIRSGVFSDWKAGRYTPKADKMQQIADFLGVPVEPLLGVQTDAQTEEYYKDIMSAMIAQQMFEDKEIRSLFHIKRNIPADISVKDKRKATNYEKKIASAEKKISRLKELYLNELITLDDYKHDLAAYKADIDTFKAEARKYKGTDKKALYDLVGRNLDDWYWTLSEGERRVIWRSVIDQIYFDNDKNIKIVFR